ncbi:hypothetical protein ACE1AT_02225 [Pelatocladus sp. BLCC-F211]|uniref:hypothetical protein n=1 Tax=Pelatocladus sp. BLCC-F211 TaxID=3342752 RepID=UPI0035B7C221
MKQLIGHKVRFPKEGKNAKTPKKEDEVKGKNKKAAIVIKCERQKARAEQASQQNRKKDF